METCSCFQPLKNGLKIAFHSNDTALELTKNNLKLILIFLHSKPGPGFQCAYAYAYAWILNETPRKKTAN